MKTSARGLDDRGEWRGIRRVLLDEPWFQDLSPDARTILVFLKLNLGPCGIELEYPDALIAKLAAQTGRSGECVAACLDELEDAGKVRRDRNVIWLVDHLADEPSIQQGTPNHRKSVRAHVLSLPRLPIVRAFIEHYRTWFDDPDAILEAYPKAQPCPPDAIRDGMSMPSPMPSASPKTEDRRPKTENSSDATRPAAGRAAGTSAEHAGGGGTPAGDAATGGPAPPGEPEVEDVDIGTLPPKHQKAIGWYLKTVRGMWWAPDAKPPDGWSEGREATIYIQRRRKGESHDDLIRMVHGARFLVDQGDVDWVRDGTRIAKPGAKLTGRVLNNTHNGARDFGSMALDAYSRMGEQTGPPARRASGPAAIGQSAELRKYSPPLRNGALPGA